jgi:hypothetical protein
MKMGMSKREARRRIESGEFIWENLRQLLKDVHPLLKGETGSLPSQVNKLMSMSMAFNIHWRGSDGKLGPITNSGDRLAAVNLLREFGVKGEVQEQKQAKEPPGLTHEELIEIEPKRKRKRREEV